jgi:hypothetical protein
MKQETKTIDLDYGISLNVGVKYNKSQYSNEDTGHNTIDESNIELISLDLVIENEPSITIRIEQLTQYSKDRILKLI